MDATIDSTGSICVFSSPFNLTASSFGGTWSGTGITDPNLGTFDPALAGTGIHLISYTISGICGDSDQYAISVDSSLTPSINPVNNLCVSEPAIFLTAISPENLLNPSIYESVLVIKLHAVSFPSK